MSESDNTWNAGSDEPEPDLEPIAPTQPPTPPTPPPTAASWPPPAYPTTPPPAPGGWGWGPPTAPPAPPSQPHAAAAAGAYAQWSPPPTPGWPAPPEHDKHNGKRIAAIVAAVAIVLGSAGVGAAIATAVNNNDASNSASTAPTFPIAPFTPGNGSNGSGNSGTTPDTNSNNNGSGGGSTDNSGPLDADEIAAQVTPAIVNINTTLSSNAQAVGTGMIVTSSGEVLTNNHVIADATSIKVTIGGKGDAHDARVIGYDVADDVALLQIEDVSDLPTIKFGDPSDVNIGDPVVALGNALGRGGTPTAVEGEVTALDQDVTAGDPGGITETLHNMIQVDAPIQPGDSGGALINANAEVIGMNTAAAGGRFRQSEGSGIGFAIPVDDAITVVSEIRDGDESNGVHIGKRALLGVQVRDASDASGLDGAGASAPVDKGALVVGVADGSAASDSGLQDGDVIVTVDGKEIADQTALHLALTVYHPGDSVEVGWVDVNGESHTATIKLGEGPPA